MTIHQFVNSHSDGSDATLSKPSDWNKVHVDSVRSISANTTGIPTDDLVLAAGGAGGITYTLPLTGGGGVGAGFTVTVIKTDTAAGVVTINPAASEKINYLNHLNGTSYSLVNVGQSVCFSFDGTNWWVKYGS